MVKKTKKKKGANPGRKVVAQNRKAYHNYFIEEKFEAGIALLGSEVKSLRSGKSNITESYAYEEGGEIFLVNAYIPEYNKAVKQFSHETRRPRRLLLHKRQIDKLSGAIKRKGYTLVALEIYFNPRGRAKVELGLGKGKAEYDKRDADKKRDWDREKARALRSDN